MLRRASAHRGWFYRRFALLGGSASVAAAALAVQARGLGNGDSWRSATLAALLAVLGIQVWLLIRHLAGDRGTRREAPWVAVGGALLALGLAFVAPLDPASLPVRTPEPKVVRVEFGRTPPPAPLPAPPVEVPVPSIAPIPLEEAPVVVPAPLPELPRIEIPPPPAPPAEPAAQDLDDTPGLRPGRRGAEVSPWPTRTPLDWEAMHRYLRLGRPEADDPSVLPPIQGTFAGLMMAARGGSSLAVPGGRLKLDLGEVHDSDDLQPALEAAFEFPISSDQSVLVRLLGVRIRERVRFSADDTVGGIAVSAGDSLEFAQDWTHVYTGYSRRLFGFRRESWFDLALHLGAALDQTSAELDIEGRVEGGTGEGERGWAAPAAGLTLGFWSPYSGGLTIELFQTLPMNLGGQSISQTDVRIVLTQDVTEKVSFFIGYRWVSATYRTYEETWGRGDSRTATELQLGGPLVGMDVRF